MDSPHKPMIEIFNSVDIIILKSNESLSAATATLSKLTLSDPYTNCVYASSHCLRYNRVEGILVVLPRTVSWYYKYCSAYKYSTPRSRHSC